MTKLMFTGLLVGGLIVGTYGQTPDSRLELTPDSIAYANECGFRVRELTELVRKAGDRRPMVIVSHLAKKESLALGNRRLHNAKAYLTSKYFQERWEQALVVTAHGNKAVATGYVDFFLDGRLALRIFLNHRSDLYLGDCGGGEDVCSNAFERQFFPCKRRF